MTTLGKILVIDDNAKLLTDALPMFGYEVIAAQDGIEGLKVLTNDNKFDLIILDVVMPKLDGWQTLKTIRSNKTTKQIPIIMLTSVSDSNKQVSGLKFGADDYIVKPFALPNLLARIEALLRRSSWNKENSIPSGISYVKKDQINELTNKEKEVLKYITNGDTTAQIAGKLFVKEVTIKSHLSSIYRKLQVENRVQAVLVAQQAGIFQEEG